LKRWGLIIKASGAIAVTFAPQTNNMHMRKMMSTHF